MIRFKSGNIVSFQGAKDDQGSIKLAYEKFFITGPVKVVSVYNPDGKKIKTFEKKKGVKYPPCYKDPAPVQLDLFAPLAIQDPPKKKPKRKNNDSGTDSAIPALTARNYFSN